MKPNVDFVLQTAGQSLHGQVMPAVTGSHLQGMTYLVGVLMSFAAVDYERGADVRMTDNNEMRALFLAAAAEQIADTVLRDRLRQSAAIKEASLRMSELDRVNDLLKQQLIELHAYVETATEGSAHEVEGSILHHLAASLQRRALTSMGA